MARALTRHYHRIVTSKHKPTARSGKKSNNHDTTVFSNPNNQCQSATKTTTTTWSPPSGTGTVHESPSCPHPTPPPNRSSSSQPATDCSLSVPYMGESNRVDPGDTWRTSQAQQSLLVSRARVHPLVNATTAKSSTTTTTRNGTTDATDDEEELQHFYDCHSDNTEEDSHDHLYHTSSSSKTNHHHLNDSMVVDTLLPWDTPHKSPQPPPTTVKDSETTRTRSDPTTDALLIRQVALWSLGIHQLRLIADSMERRLHQAKQALSQQQQSKTTSMTSAAPSRRELVDVMASECRDVCHDLLGLLQLIHSSSSSSSVLQQSPQSPIQSPPSASPLGA